MCNAPVNDCSSFRLEKGTDGLMVSHLLHFALSTALLLPSSVNSSTLHELGAGEHWRDGRERRESWVGELDWATLSSVDLLHWSCPGTHTHNSTDTCARARTHTHDYACPEKYFHMHVLTHRLKCSPHPLSPWLRPSNGAGRRALLHLK